MKVSLRWIRELLPTLEADRSEIVRRLALRGAPVEGISEPWEELGDVVVGRVVELRRHPRANRLSLCKVDAGTNEPIQVVCGAPNVEVGAFYPFAPAGSTLPGGVKLKKARIRGESSHGMLCSPSELDLGEDQSGILRLDGVHAPGSSFVKAAGLDDATLDVEVTANRGDLLSHLGIARELASDEPPRPPPLPGAGKLSLEWTEAAVQRDGKGDGRRENGEDGARSSSSGRTAVHPGPTAVRPEPAAVSAGGVSVTIAEPALCSRYVGAVVRGVSVAPSPDWLRHRLIAAGSRPINNVVDATNYVLHELGHPLHAFDLAKIGESRVVVRTPREADRSFTTLDGEVRRLDSSMLMIYGGSGPAAIAGVMGGRDSGVSGATSDLLLECALFDSRSVRKTRKALGLSTDASHRFERGVDPEGIERAIERTIALILATAGGRAGQVLDCCPVPFEAARISLRLARIERVLGLPFTAEAVRELLGPLGFEVTVEAGGTIEVRVPGFRSHDVTREIDLIEEVARTHGFDRFPDVLGAFRPSAVPDDPAFQFEDELRDELCARGLYEVQSPAFVSEREGEVRLANPIAAPEPVVRRELLPSVLRTIERNLASGNRDLRLFEMGTSFRAAQAEAAPVERTHLAVALTGRHAPMHWSSESEASAGRGRAKGRAAGARGRGAASAENGGSSARDRSRNLGLWDFKGLLEDVAHLSWGGDAKVRPAFGPGSSGVAEKAGEACWGRSSCIAPGRFDPGTYFAVSVVGAGRSALPAVEGGGSHRGAEPHGKADIGAESDAGAEPDAGAEAGVQAESDAESGAGAEPDAAADSESPGERIVGWGGLVTGDLDLPEWADEIWGFELELPSEPHAPSDPIARIVPPYPPSERDLALRAPREVQFDEVEGSIRHNAGPLLEKVEFFDLYTGKHTGPDHRSLAFRLRFRSPKRTLRDREVDRYVARVTAALKRDLGVEQRS